MLSSVLKRMDNAVFDAIETAIGLDGANAWPETLTSARWRTMGSAWRLP